MQELDERIVRVGIEIDGVINTYEGLAISATGTRYANANQNECEVKIVNLNTQNRNLILTETSPFNLNKTPKKLFLYAGRKSWGTTLVFQGNVVTAVPSQPPDIALTLKCLSENFEKGKVVARSYGANTNLSEISAGVANDLNATLDFQATDKQISNYTFSGGALNQVGKLGTSGDIDAYLDNGILVVKDAQVPLSGVLTIVNSSTGMIGQPEITERGIKVKFLIDGQTTVGGAVQVKSKINPAANGTYVIYKLNFEISSRDIPFYWVAEGIRQ